jgi:hypothetical protein
MYRRLTEVDLWTSASPQLAIHIKVYDYTDVVHVTCSFDVKFM